VSTDLLRALLHSLEAEIPAAVALRERLHAIPEPSHGEGETAALIAKALGAESVSRVAGTGLVARTGPGGKRAVALRAELDALPIEEATGAPFAATNGLMHACGHDVHMAALVALFRAARRLEDKLPRPLLALYQPSEEAYPSGAEIVVREGVLADAAGAVVAVHVHPGVPWGAVSVEAGPVNASSDNLRISIEGVGGHGAYPHLARDPIVALSHAIVALQSLVSRRLDPTHAGVFSVGWTRAGSAENVIPGIAEAGGTLRVLQPEDRQPLREAARDLIEATARAHGCVATVEVTEGEPTTVNDPALAERARSLLPEAGFDLAPPMRSCGSDDFGFYGQSAPTLMMFVGLRGGPGMEDLPLHHPRFLPPDEAVGAVARAQAVAFTATAATR
jgi:amidohydrolase